MHLRVIFILLSFLSAFNIAAQNVFFSANDDNSIFLCQDGRVFLTGENNVGQLGIGTVVPTNIPIPLGGINGKGSAPRCKQVALEGVTTFLALTNSGDTVLSWGPNDFGQVGDGTTQKSLFPYVVKGIGGVGNLKNIKQISSGNASGYALTNDGKVLSWGININGQAGIGNMISPLYFPEYVLKAPGDTLKNVKMISGGGTFCLALLCDGSVWAWGKNHVGQLGQNNKTDSPYAVPVKDKSGKGVLKNIIKVEAADNYGYALSNNDTLWCWGPNWDGRLGTGDTKDHILPEYVRSTDGTKHLSGVVEIAGGQGHAIALMSDKTVVSWGLNDFGQLGKNDTLDSNLPVRVKDPSGSGLLQDVNYITVGDIHCIARTTNNQLYVWGGNPLGQLGLNDHVNRWLPVLLALPCEPDKDIFPGNGKMEYTSSACLNSNNGTVFITKFHSTIERWEESIDSFKTFKTVSNTTFTNPYKNLNKKTYYRVLLNDCGKTFYSPIASVGMDSLTVGGRLDSSMSVRIGRNQDTLHLADYKGKILSWEYSKDNFRSDLHIVKSSDSSFIFSDLSTTTYYRAYIQRGNCPAAYSTIAIITTINESAVKIYNGFTPNGDNINDEWVIEHIGLFPDNKVEIFNRWGQLVYRNSSYNNESRVWKGENNISDKEPLADGTYFYVVNLGEGQPVMKGYVVINR